MFSAFGFGTEAIERMHRCERNAKLNIVGKCRENVFPDVQLDMVQALSRLVVFILLAGIE